MHILQEAGWPVYGVLVLGTVALVQAVRYVRGATGAGGVIAATASVLFGGALATAWGIQMAFGGIRQLPDPASQHWIALIGVKESLYNLDIALLFALVAAMVASAAGRRADVASNA
jgi:uncharacterized protein (DUF697 family)